MQDVRGYEEKRPETMRAIANAYPRFVVHIFARRLAEHYVATDPTLAGRTLWLCSSARMAAAAAAHLGPTATVFDRDGLHGLSHPVSPDLHAQAKVYLQNLGGYLSSREAEDHLVRLGLQPVVHPEETYAGDAPAEIKRHLLPMLPGATADDLILSGYGMSAVHAAFRAVSEVQAPRGRTIWIQLGWLYLDTIAIFKKYTPTPADYVYVRDVQDLDALRRIFAAHGSRIAGLITELPTNPLIQTPDLPAIADLCRRHGALLVTDPSSSSIFNLDVLRYSDALISSLTKYTASEGDLTAGLCVVNPAIADAATLRRKMAGWVEPLYSRDAARLAWQIAQTRDVVARINAGTARVAAFLERHPKVRDVYWALHPASRDHYLKIARGPGATGGMITFTLREIGSMPRVHDRLRLPKGPSFGMKNTLLCPFLYLTNYDLVTTAAGLAELAASKLDPDLLRLCVGTEPPEAIIAALAEALE